MSNCAWANMNERNQIYHDNEWGVPVHDDRVMFEHFCMECLQCGLSWDLMLRKRQIFRACFDDFDFDKMAEYDDTDLERILSTEGMIRSKQKIQALIHNAKCWRQVRSEYGSFSDYLWSYTDGNAILYEGHENGRIPVNNALSSLISKDLKKRGFKYVGPVTVYSHLQACGIINDHDETCPCYKRLKASHPYIRKPREEEVF